MTKFPVTAHLAIILIFLCAVSANFTSSIENHIGPKVRDEPGNPFADGSQFNHEASCHKSTQRPCEPLWVETCFGVKLPYTHTSTELVSEDFSLSQVHVKHKLKQWEGLKALPKCWAAIQPLLCSLYMPKCENGSVELPPQEICKIARGPCKIMDQAFPNGLPDFLKCDNFTKFPINCKPTGFRELRFNVSLGNCTDPMIDVAENSINEYKGFEGCGLKCQDVFFDDAEHEQLSNFIFYFGIITLLATGWVVITYIIGWRSSSHYPPIIIFYVNLSYFVASIGWMFQFLPKAKDGIVCRGDSTVRKLEYSPGETVSCTFVFVLIYWGSMCALNWLVVFAYVWNQTCHAVGRIREGLEKKARNFHISWILGSLLTIASYIWGNVGGNSMTGICFIGYSDSVRRIVFLLVPIGVKVLIIGFFLWRGVYRLCSLSTGKASCDYISNQGKLEIKRYMIRVATFAVLLFVVTFLVFVFEANAIWWRPFMEKSLKETLLCRLNLVEGVECEPLHKAGLIYHASVYLFFGGGILVSSTAWTSESVGIWKRFFSRFTNSQNPSASMQQQPGHKHRLIAKAFSKRNDLAANGRLSLSIGVSHDDPLGFNKLFDPNRIGNEVHRSHSQGLTDQPVDISSEWAANLPNFVERRGAIIPPHSSNSVSCMSDDSRRPSCDSAGMSGLAARNLQGGSQSDLEDRSRRSKRRWYNMGRHNRSGRMFNFGRRGIGGSSTSVSSAASNPQPRIYPAITALIEKKMGQNGQFGLTQVITQRPMTREIAIQTSFERLAEGGGPRFGIVCDKETQSSQRGLHEVAVQTKKSATKKRAKDHEKHHEKKNGLKERDAEHESQVLKLLSPNL